MKRLIKSIFYSMVKNGDEHIEIYQNPTSAEISKIKEDDLVGSIRGVIYDDGTIYAWGGELWHRFVKNNIDINQFRFAIDSNGWFIDAHRKYTEDEIINLINKYKDILSQFGDINKDWEIGGLKEGDSDKYLYNSDEIFNKELVLTSRLIESELHDAQYMNSENYIEVYINPDQREIDLIKKQNNSVRGVIDKNGDKYIWDGYLISHFTINNYFKEKPIPVDYFRFVYGVDDKLIVDLRDLGSQITVEECKEILRNNLDFFRQIGNIDKISIFNIKNKNNEDTFYRGPIDRFLNQKLEQISRLAKNNKMFEVNMSPLSPLYPGYYTEKSPEIEENEKKNEEMSNEEIN